MGKGLMDSKPNARQRSALAEKAASNTTDRTERRTASTLWEVTPVLRSAQRRQCLCPPAQERRPAEVSSEDAHQSAPGAAALAQRGEAEGKMFVQPADETASAETSQ